MCRHKSTGIPRCSTDTSLARKHRRIANKIKRGIVDRQETEPLLLEEHSEPSIERLRELLAKAKLASPYDPDYDLYVTRAGEEIAGLTDRLMLVRDGLLPAEAIALTLEQQEQSALGLFQKSQQLATNIVHQKEWNATAQGDDLQSGEKALQVLEKKFLKVRKKAQGLEQNRLKEAREYSKKIAQAHLDVLSLVRDMGGSITNDTDISNPTAVRTLNKALKYIPSEWIALSNKGDQMTVKNSSTRAHYRPDFHVTRTRVPARIMEEKEKDWSPTPSEALSEGWQIENTRGNVSTWSRLEFEEFQADKGSFDDYGNPMGNRWRQYTRGDGTVSWRRTILREVEKASEGSELFVSPGDDGESVAIHEYTHRVEHANAQLLAAEKLHHARRTKLADGTPQPVERYHYQETSELVQPNHYADRYMGRVYADDSEFTEIASNGVQALFYGEHGGFMGIGGRHDPDPVSRAFTLGALAVC